MPIYYAQVMFVRSLISRILLFGVATALVVSTSGALPNRTVALKSLPSASESGDTEDVTAAELDAQQKLDSVTKNQNSIAAKIIALDLKIKDAQQAVFDAQAAVDEAEEKFDKINSQYKRMKKKVDAGIALERAQAADLYTSGGGDKINELAMSLDVNSLQEYSHRTVVMNAIGEHRKKVLQELVTLKAKAQKLKKQAQKVFAAAKKKRNDLADVEVELQENRIDLAGLNNQAVSEAKRQAEILEVIRGQKVDYLSRIASLQTKSSSISIMLAKLQAHQKVAKARHGIFERPIPGASVSSVFGPRIHPIYGTVRMHTGIDFRASSGTEIHAARSGEVVFAGTAGGYGNCTIIEHGNGLATLYAHQSVIFVHVGTKVDKGEVIGRVGSTGLATGPHLHFEVRRVGTPVDPFSYL